MAKEPLAVKYRPTDFSSLTEQSAIKDILENQIKTKTFQHGYLFTGPSGTGKTTSARIFASMINDGKGNPIEVDAASNSGVDNIRQIIEDAKRKPLDAEYKIFIVDECHSLSNGAWQALLKTFWKIKLRQKHFSTGIFLPARVEQEKQHLQESLQA